MDRLIVRMKGVPKDGFAGKAIIPEDSDVILLESSENQDLKPWDKAHLAWQQNSDITFSEPDIIATSDYFPVPADLQQLVVVSKGAATEEEYKTFLDYWPHPEKPSVWHLDDDYSQLRSARDLVGAGDKIVRIAHFDTGYDPDHLSFPGPLVRKDLQQNFVDGEDSNDATDPFDSGVLRTPGHGTGTLSILAGNKMSLPWCGFDDYFGLKEGVEIVPIRIAKSVVLLKTSAFVKALDYVLNTLNKDEGTRVHIITMSMGGLAAAAWADMVNEAYDKGVFIVAAAGNNFDKLPTRTLVYPARFKRVVAACGVAYDYTPYHKGLLQGGLDVMEGNYGPRALMGTALAAFTPNVTWAPFRYDDIVGIRGDGTSSATPQIAAAAALYYKKYYKDLEALPEGWMKVEAIRKALFSSAKQYIKDEDGDYEKFYGNGVLRAKAMLEIPVPAADTLTQAEKDTVSFPFFRLIFQTRDITEDENGPTEMLETELMQLVLASPELQRVLKNEEADLTSLTDEELKRFIDAILSDKEASDTLKRNMLEVRRALIHARDI